MKKLILFILAIIILYNVIGTYKQDYYVIPNEAIRIRIIPNSNTPKDQLLKKNVKTNIELDVENDLKDSKTIDESRTIIKSNISKYENTVSQVLKNENKNQKYKVDFGYHYFPEKTYKGVKYKEGNYESLLVTLGEGKGDNWWCVLFPPICSLEAQDTGENDIKYSFYVKELIEKYLK